MNLANFCHCRARTGTVKQRLVMEAFMVRLAVLHQPFLSMYRFAVSPAIHLQRCCSLTAAGPVLRLKTAHDPCCLQDSIICKV